MTDNHYPVYADGQTLTSSELNTTTSFLKRRDQVLGRAIGFGVSCGLSGSITMPPDGPHVVITPGLAVDQAGEVLPLLDQRDLAVTPSDPVPSYAFIDPSVAGFSVVLEATETDPGPEPCTQAGCGGHPSMHVTDVALEIVPGRLTSTFMDFSTETLLTVKPMQLTPQSDPIGSYPTLRNAVADRLKNQGQPLIDQTFINALLATGLAAGDLPGVKGYKCGWLNMVLFAVLDLLRCEALCALPCDRTTTRDGVVLGWVHQGTGGSWVFDCSFRHAWEPPRGFTEAFLGGTCADPCALYRARVEGLIGSYAPPDPPPPGGGGVPPKVDHCKHPEIKLKDCFVIQLPPVKIPDDWTKWWTDPKIVDPRIPIWNPPEWVEPPDIYQLDGFDQLEDGYIHGGGLLGHTVDAVTDVLTQTVKDAGNVAHVVVKQPDELQTLSGYAPSEGFSPSDTMVLTVGADQRTVIGIGRVSVLQTTREVGTALPTAVAAADQATKAAAGVQATVGGFVQRVGEFDTRMKTFDEGLTALQGQFTAYAGGKFDQPSIEQRLTTLESSVKKVGDVNERMHAVEGGLAVLTGIGRKGFAQGFDTGLARGISAFASTTVEAMKSLGQVDNKNFARYTADAERAQAELDLAVANDDPAALTVATLNLLSSLRTVVKASGVSPDIGRQLDAHVRGLQGMIG